MFFCVLARNRWSLSRKKCQIIFTPIFDRVEKSQDSQGNLVLMTSVREYIHYVGLDAYIKQFLTFKIMKDLYPDNILLSTYENLVREPQTTFLSVLNHFGHDIEPRLHLVVVEMALSLSNRKSIMQIENLMGRSLANDQQELSERHIRSGTVGGWKAHFNDADLAKIEQRLEQFGLSLADFEIE